MNKLTPYQFAVAELVLAGSIWGFSFICTVWSLEAMGPMWLVIVRFLVVLTVGLPALWLPRLQDSRSWEQLRLAFWPGIFLGFTMLFQTWGLRYTTATKSSFITVIYVLIVPFIERVFMKRRLPPKIVLFACLGLIGTAMICEFSPLDPTQSRWNVGDLLTLGCSFAGALQIIVIGAVATRIKSSFVYNLYQTLWALLVPLAAAPFFEVFQFNGFTAKSLFGLLFVALGSTLVAFMLQVRAQKVLSSSLASMLFLLESPFAGTFAFFFLGEQLSFTQWAGAGLIIASAAGAIRADQVRQVS